MRSIQNALGTLMGLTLNVRAHVNWLDYVGRHMVFFADVACEYSLVKIFVVRCVIHCSK